MIAENKKEKKSRVTGMKAVPPLASVICEFNPEATRKAVTDFFDRMPDVAKVAIIVFQSVFMADNTLGNELMDHFNSQLNEDACIESDWNGGYVNGLLHGLTIGQEGERR